MLINTSRKLSLPIPYPRINVPLMSCQKLMIPSGVIPIHFIIYHVIFHIKQMILLFHKYGCITSLKNAHFTQFPLKNDHKPRKCQNNMLDKGCIRSWLQIRSLPIKSDELVSSVDYGIIILVII